VMMAIQQVGMDAVQLVQSKQATLVSTQVLLVFARLLVVTVLRFLVKHAKMETQPVVTDALPLVHWKLVGLVQMIQPFQGVVPYCHWIFALLLTTVEMDFDLALKLVTMVI